MASTVRSTPNTFVNIYSAQFLLGKTDFDTMSALFLGTLSNCNTPIQRTPENKKVYEHIEVAKEGLQTLVNAQNDYLNNTLFGRIEKAFQSLLGWIFSEKSTVERAQGEIDRLNAKGFRDHSPIVAKFEDMSTRSENIKRKINRPNTARPNSSTVTVRKEAQALLTTLEDTKAKSRSLLAESKNIVAKSQAMLARSIAIRENATISIVLGDEANPSTILIAKPNGDVYEIPRSIESCKGQGSPNPGARRFHQGTLHSKDGTSKQIGITTNLTTRPLDQYDTPGIVSMASIEALTMNKEEREKHIAKATERLVQHNKDVLNEVSIRMKKEFEFLKSLEGISGIINAYDNFSVDISGTNACFTIVDYHPNGDLTKNKIEENKKLQFTLDLISSCLHLHSNEILHRDLKPENILVDADLKPVLTDFETSISTKDELGKKSNASSVRYMPPEYINALLNGVYNYIENGDHKYLLPTYKPLFPLPTSALRRNAAVTQTVINILAERDPSVDLAIFLPSATTKAMDVWSLGLILFNLNYDVNLIDRVFEFEFRCSEQSSELMKTQLMHDILIEELPKFIAAMKSDEPPKDNEQWTKVWHSIKTNPFAWNMIILPMLSADPKQRQSMEDLHAKLENHIDSQLVGDEDSLITDE